MFQSLVDVVDGIIEVGYGIVQGVNDLLHGVATLSVLDGLREIVVSFLFFVAEDLNGLLQLLGLAESLLKLFASCFVHGSICL